VFIDGQPRGVTPLTVELAPGSHELKIATEDEPRIIPFTVTAGNTVAHAIEVPRAAPRTGQLMVRSEPAGARVIIEGTERGTTPLTIEGLAPGTHSVTVRNDLSSVTEDVIIEAGIRASLVIPLTAPQGIPVSGWISVTAPAEVQVYENDRLLGTSQSDRIMVSAGTHALEIVNEALGYRTTRSIVVSPGKGVNHPPRLADRVDGAQRTAVGRGLGQWQAGRRDTDRQHSPCPSARTRCGSATRSWVNVWCAPPSLPPSRHAWPWT
jgi:hypothetical protein